MNDYDTPEIRCSLRNLSRVTEWVEFEGCHGISRVLLRNQSRIVTESVEVCHGSNGCYSCPTKEKFKKKKKRRHISRTLVFSSLRVLKMAAHDIWKKKSKKYCPHINNSREELYIIRTCTCGHCRFKACSYMFMITFWKFFYWKKFFFSNSITYV